MNYSELNQFLRNCTPNEKPTFEYELDEVELKYRETCKSIKINGEDIFILDAHELPTFEDISFSKHPRFVYTPKHIHNFVEITYVYSGKCTQIINNRRIDLFEGDMCIMDKNFIHQLEISSENDILLNIVIRNSAIYRSLLENLSANNIVTNFLKNVLNINQNHDKYILFKNDINNDKLRPLILNMLCEYFGETVPSSKLIKAYLQIILFELIKNYDYRTNFNSIDETKDLPIVEILNYIELNIKNCSLEETALKFNYHPNYLTSALKKITGKSFKELLIEQRINKAVDLLLYTNMPIAKICEYIGYNNAHFFHKKFLEIYQTTPKQFRISHKNE